MKRLIILIFLFFISSYGRYNDQYENKINNEFNTEISLRSPSIDSAKYDYFYSGEYKLNINKFDFSVKGTHERQNDSMYDAIFFNASTPYIYFIYVYDEEINTEAYRYALTYPMYDIFKIGLEYSKEITFNYDEEFSIFFIIDIKDWFLYSFYWFGDIKRYEITLGPSYDVNKHVKLGLKYHYYNDDLSNETWHFQLLSTFLF